MANRMIGWKSRALVAPAAALVTAMALAWTSSASGQVAAATAPARIAPSFDCTRATEEAEKLVCANPDLSTLDHDLQQAYMGALAHVEPGSRTALKKEQRNWIRYVRNVCADSGCLHEAYASRIALLGRNEPIIYNDGGSCSDFGARECNGVVFFRDPTAEISSFNKSISNNGKLGQIITCNRLIDLPVGYARSNHSFGAYCTLQTRSVHKQVVICNDLMWGHFAMESVGNGQQSDTNLVQFTNAHCFGG